MALLVPLIEVSNDRDALGIRRPHGEARPVFTVHRPQMRTQSLPEFVMRALVEEMNVVVRNECRLWLPRIAMGSSRTHNAAVELMTSLKKMLDAGQRNRGPVGTIIHLVTKFIEGFLHEESREQRTALLWLVREKPSRLGTFKVSA
jgi:hypothetical protein